MWRVTRLLNSIPSCPSRYTRIHFTPFRMVATDKDKIRTTNGQTPMSIHEPNNFLNYDKYEHNLQIIRDRYGWFKASSSAS